MPWAGRPRACCKGPVSVCWGGGVSQGHEGGVSGAWAGHGGGRLRDRAHSVDSCSGAGAQSSWDLDTWNSLGILPACARDSHLLSLPGGEPGPGRHGSHPAVPPRGRVHTGRPTAHLHELQSPLSPRTATKITHRADGHQKVGQDPGGWRRTAREGMGPRCPGRPWPWACTWSLLP